VKEVSPPTRSQKKNSNLRVMIPSSLESVLVGAQAESVSLSNAS
jgi:hypothetical protein